MIKRILFTLLFILIGFSAFSQKGHRIAFIDMNYILENIPDYKKAQDQLNLKVQKWQQNLDAIKGDVETMKTDLSNEKALLTEDLIAERKEDIVIKEEEFKKLEEQYFSSNGNLFLLRKQLVTPIQDQVYNAAQEIAKARRYDFVFDKSSDLIMLYSTKQNDISELILRSIVRGEKITKATEKRASSATNTRRNSTPTVVNTPSSIVTQETDSSENSTTESIEKVEEQKEIAVNEPLPLSAEEAKQATLNERELKRQAALAKNEKIKAERLKKREEQKAAIEKKRLERLKKREEARNKLKENKETTEKEKEDKKEDDNKDNNN